LIDHQPHSTRGSWDDVAALVPSIEAAGILQPVIVRPKGDRYELMVGERRLRAAILAKQKTIPAIVREAADGQALEWSLIENLTHKALNPIEKATLLRRLSAPVAEGGLGQSLGEISLMLKKSRPWATNVVRLLELPAEWQQAVADGKIGQGRFLLRFLDRPEVLEAAKRDMEQNPWAWITTEQFENSLNALAGEGEGNGSPATSPAKVLAALRAIPDKTQRSPDVRLCHAISRLADLAALDRIQSAIEARRQELLSQDSPSARGVGKR
jgi:ParB family chromosome partitioning protein